MIRADFISALLDDLLFAIDFWAEGISGVGEKHQDDADFDDRSPAWWRGKSEASFEELAGHLRITAITLLAADRRDYLAQMVASAVDEVRSIGLHFAEICAASNSIPNVRRWKHLEGASDFGEMCLAKLKSPKLHPEDRPALVTGLQLFQSLGSLSLTLGAIGRSIEWVEQSQAADSDLYADVYSTDSKESFTPKELAAHFGISTTTLNTYAKRAKVTTPPRFGGQSHRYSRSDFERIADIAKLSNRRHISENATLLARLPQHDGHN